MRFKYYLRGIGIGVTLATLLLTISFYFGQDTLNKEKLTDEEIIEKATALGMVMPEEESEEVTVEDEEVAKSALDSDSQVQLAEPQEGASVTDTAEPETEKKTEELSLDKAIEEAASKNEEKDETITYVPFTVRGGESSEIVSQNLYKKGLVDNAKDFNAYLNKLDVDNLVKTGTFYIQQGSSYDDIVALLVNKSERTTTPPKAQEPPTAPEKPSTPKAEQ